MDEDALITFFCSIDDFYAHWLLKKEGFKITVSLPSTLHAFVYTVPTYELG